MGLVGVEAAVMRRCVDGCIEIDADTQHFWWAVTDVQLLLGKSDAFYQISPLKY